MSHSIEYIAEIEPRNATALNSVSILDLPATEAELMLALDKASANIMRLAGNLGWTATGSAASAREDELALKEQRALARKLIERLLTLPAAPVRH
jgi:hypothetical protein